ncbi:Oxoglutarate/iron-dependent dioxygenase [Gossypium australe]|uniref:Oxoglutarate/iron-dependent dioxygenase n=1 Tax=Gossypium australe TaxID=47621 RepID=A0A5B6W6C4_9ROSI|nr:Oxoglutarate/iron-dependent dioxygenase [Gossypium australe]
MEYRMAMKNATFGENEIAYQIGETTEILSQGYLCATPHCVRAPKGKEVSGVDRSTFALFMQPDWYVNRR